MVMESFVEENPWSVEHIYNDGAARRKYVDQLKGFAYFETFDELQEWREDAVDPLQRTNTPLFKPPDAAALSGRLHKSKTMLIHDYAGGYLDYESCQGSISQKELYSCRYLQWVDTFVYFSHRLVTVPPPTWMNTCHRNGVKILGTFIVEPGSSGVDRILDEDENGIFWVAKNLACMAKTYGFDGWLINIETSFTPLAWSCEKLERFLRQLRAELGGDCKLVWYDALTPLNFVWYQNGLNHLNLPFALAAGSFLSNYAWSPEIARQGKQLAEQSGLGVENLYFGIDVWAQNAQRDPRHPRITWPYPGGGGTGTGLGMRALKPLGATLPGVGIFAPAWSFEHFPDNATAVDESMWLGTYLPADCPCECGPTSPHSAVPYQQNGITRYAQRNVVGTGSFFHTDFGQAFSRDRAGEVVYAHFGSQHPSPLGRRVELIQNESPYEHLGYLSTATVEESRPQCALKVDVSSADRPKCMTSGRLQLFEFGICRKESFLVTVRYCQKSIENCEISLVIACSSGNPFTIQLSSTKGRPSTAHAVITAQDGYISGASMHFSCTDTSSLPSGETTVVDLHAITIQPWPRFPSRCEPIDIRAEHRGPGDCRHLRLCWEIEFPPGTSATPISDITGPCAFFKLHRNGRELGRAYALEYVVSQAEAEQWKVEGESVVEVAAIGFNGSTLGVTKTLLPWPVGSETDWVVVTPASERASFI